MDNNIVNKKNKLRKVSIILGIIGIVSSFTLIFSFVGIIFSLIGLVVTIISFKNGRNILGMFLNIIGIILSCLVICAGLYLNKYYQRTRYVSENYLDFSLNLYENDLSEFEGNFDDDSKEGIGSNGDNNYEIVQADDNSYYILIWVDENDEESSNIGSEFKGQIIFTSPDNFGTGITGSFNADRENDKPSLEEENEEDTDDEICGVYEFEITSPENEAEDVKKNKENIIDDNIIGLIKFIFKFII